MSALDSRLSLCASFVRQGCALADIGTDHAYLPVWLCLNGVCKSAVAADINPEPLARGEQNIALSGLEGVISVRLSDGLQNIESSEADDIVIAGMGGELIAQIISNWQYSRDIDKHFILQPMTKSEFLIDWLSKNGYKILEQDCCVAAGKCYTVLLVKYTGEADGHGELFCYLGRLNPRKNATHLRFVEGHIDRLTKKAKGDARFAVLAKSLKEAAYGNGA